MCVNLNQMLHSNVVPPYTEPYFFSFNENDVIEVDLNAPAEPEWFFGTCQGRAGLFPQGP